MTQEITTKVKTHVIVTHSGAGHFITSEQNAKLVDIGLDDLFEINDEGEKIKGSAIAEVMTVDKYYLTFPKRMPQNYGQPPSNKEYPDTRTGKGFRERMVEHYEKHPEDKNTKGYKFFQEHLAKGGSPESKKAKFIYDPNNESWDEFKLRAGL